MNESLSLPTDLRSTALQEDIAKRATTVAQRIPEIEAVVLRGSLATHNGDVFSDIDMLLLAKDAGHLEPAKSAFLSQSHEIGNVLHSYSPLVNPTNHILFFEPLVKLELDFKTYEQAARTWKTATAQVLFDRSGLGRSAVDASQKRVFDAQAHKPFLSSLAAIVPAAAYFICGYYTRGERLTALDDLDWLRNQMLQGSSYLLGMWDEGPRRAEARFPPEVLRYYRHTRAVSTNSIWRAVGMLLEWYTEWMIPLFVDTGVKVPDDFLRRVRPVIAELERRDVNCAG